MTDQRRGMAQQRGSTTHAYGDQADQYGALYLPDGEVPTRGWPAVMLIHGGFWRERYRRDLTAPLAAHLAEQGMAAWNIEFRRVEGAGGWPATFDDVAAALDHLAAPELAIDTSRVVVVGHSAGGHLALWAAGRAKVPVAAPGANPRVVPNGVVALAPVADLHACHASGLSDGAAQQLLGGGPDEVPERWVLADPIRGVGHGIPVLLVHGLEDTDVPVALSRSYLEASREAGDPVEVSTPAADHMTLIDPASPAWDVARGWIVERLRPGAGAT
jgi:acetyl esterase/lipase